jgi:hypothetical protein
VLAATYGTSADGSASNRLIEALALAAASSA